jgi:hypothetical protein
MMNTDKAGSLVIRSRTVGLKIGTTPNEASREARRTGPPKAASGVAGSDPGGAWVRFLGRNPGAPGMQPVLRTDAPVLIGVHQLLSVFIGVPAFRPTWAEPSRMSRCVSAPSVFSAVNFFFWVPE